MKASSHYKYAVSIVKNLNKVKKTIIEEFAEASSHKIVELNTRLQVARAQVSTVQEFMYEVCTAEEIRAIVSEEIIEPNFSWSSEERFNKEVLPKERYCKHEQWSKDLKLQALMPNKRF